MMMRDSELYYRYDPVNYNRDTPYTYHICLC